MTREIRDVDHEHAAKLNDAINAWLASGVNPDTLAGVLIGAGIRMERGIGCERADTLQRIGELWDNQDAADDAAPEEEGQEPMDATNTPDNVIPPNELARRRRVHELADILVAMGRGLALHVLEYRELGVPATDWWPLMLERVETTWIKEGLSMPMVPTIIDLLSAVAAEGAASAEKLIPQVLKRIAGLANGSDPIEASLASTMTSVLMGVTGPGPLRHDDGWPVHQGDCLRRVIQRLFAEAPKLTGTDGTTKQTPAIEAHVVLRSGSGVMGSLSETPEGTLRLLAPNKVDGKDVLVEHFFTYDDVVDVAVIRPIAQRPTIFTS